MAAEGGGVATVVGAGNGAGGSRAAWGTACGCSASASSSGADSGADEAAACGAGARGMAADAPGFTDCGAGAGASASGAGGDTSDATTSDSGARGAATAGPGFVGLGLRRGAAAAGSCAGCVAFAGASMMMVRVSMGCRICETACCASPSGPRKAANCCSVQACASTTSSTIRNPVIQACCPAERPVPAFSEIDATTATGIRLAVRLLTTRRFARQKCGRRAASSQSQPTPGPNPSAAPPP